MSLGLGHCPVRSPLLRASQLISLPPGTEMFQFPGFASGLRQMTDVATRRVAPFGHLGINACVPLPRAFRSLPRPSSPPCAQAFPTCLRLLDYITLRQAEHARSSRVTILRKSTQFDSLSHDLPSLPLSNSGYQNNRKWELDERGARPTVRFSALGLRERLLTDSVKEVIQPQVPLRLPCYDFAPVTALAFGRLVLAVPTRTSGAHSFHGVTGGVYKARERIHRGVADPRLLAIPASWRRVAASNPH